MLVGQTIGPFLVDQELGSGAMGAVFRGTHQGTGQLVAIKIISTGLALNETALARFQREASILKQLQHPHIVRILATGKLKGTPFYVMEYLEGESLDRVLERRGRLTWEEVVDLGQQLCGALQHAHDHGIIHRDLKPSNLFLVKDGSLKLTDFGIAKDIDVTGLTATNATVGTAAYMAPEQCRGLKDLTPKADLYSLGIVFYELLTGVKPFQAESIMEMFRQHTKVRAERVSRRVDLPIWLDNLVGQLLEKDPEKRPLNATLVAQALAQVREKWDQQRSAGVEAASRRRVDRTSQDIPLDEGDKEIARTLLGKKKKKDLPIYRRGWFTGLAVGLLTLLFGGFLYAIFFKKPSAESLLREADRYAEADDWETRLKARAPWQQFLDYYPDHAEAARVRKRKDDLDCAECERALFRRRDKFKAQGEAEPIARAALDFEDEGRVAEARQTWLSLGKFKNDADPDVRAFALLGERAADRLRAVDDQYKELNLLVFEEGIKKVKVEPKNMGHELALQAVRLEQQKNPAGARLAWDDLKKHAARQEERAWWILANKRLREMVLEKK